MSRQPGYGQLLVATWSLRAFGNTGATNRVAKLPNVLCASLLAATRTGACTRIFRSHRRVSQLVTTGSRVDGLRGQLVPFDSQVLTTDAMWRRNGEVL